LGYNSGMTQERKIVIVAGPNGAGKTTFAREFLPNEAHCPVFINADLIAAGLSPFNPDTTAIRAGRIMIEEIRSHVARQESFAFETTLASLNYARHIPGWQSQGYHVKLFFLLLPTPEMAIARVALRVSQGGHDVPEAVIRRRFAAGLSNFHTHYKAIVDAWALFDNSGIQPVLLEGGEKTP
jgi:predicted ABC-type ATPase